jgi:hypothetical protein
VKAGWEGSTVPIPRWSAFQQAQPFGLRLSAGQPGPHASVTCRLADMLKYSNPWVGRRDVDTKQPSFWPLLSLF